METTENRFDAHRLAAEAAADGRNVLAAVVGQALGAVSVCWERVCVNPDALAALLRRVDPQGFLSGDLGVAWDADGHLVERGTGAGRAAAIADDLIGWLEQRETPREVRLQPDERLVLVLDPDPSGPGQVELAAEALREWLKAGDAGGWRGLLVANATALILPDGTDVSVRGPSASGDVYAGEREAAQAGESQGCKAAVDIAGQHVPCTLQPGHDGWAHSNSKHEVIWKGAGGELGG